MENIKYFTVSKNNVSQSMNLNGYSFSLSSPGLSKGIPTQEVINDIFIEFNDGSTVEIMDIKNDPWYSNTDMTKGRNKNSFLKKHSPFVASKKLISLYEELGETETNKGKVIFLSTNNIKIQIQL